ncbi:hypothetical protein LR48_Vigan561s003400 [Vigna angularis]|uniref:Protein EMBRYONIC FLOWER 1 n=1 Tax=Phaseolus angularis TaxID=3914 RepID=A0A0L9TER5_PHAAN|nr:hypothetical protein LR48_Vigan561s003400 [Vigna angularis]
MGSYIHIDSISIDLAESTRKRDAGKCEHFSIRGYVSEIRRKDWKICWPFQVHESDKQPSFLPLDAPKYRCRRCQNSAVEIAAKDIQKDEQTDLNCCSTECRSGSNCNNEALKSGIQEDPMLDAVERREIDLNTALSCINDFLPNSNEKGSKAGVVPSRIIDLDSGLEDNLNHQVTSIPSPKNYPDLTPPEVRATKKDCESNEVSLPGLFSNLKCTEKSSSEMCNGGITAANQSQNDVIKACTVFRKGATVMEEVNNTDDHPSGPPLELVACNDTATAGSIDNTVENDFQDHHSEKSTGLSRRRPRKVRLMSDLLSDNGELKTEQNLIKESVSLGTSHASAASQAQSILPGKGDIEGGFTLTSTGPRKRKFPLDEVRRPTNMGFQRVENEVQNSQVVIKATDTLLDARSNFKDVSKGIYLQDATKGRWNKTESERSRIISKKKNKKIQGVDNSLISEQPVGQHRENEETMHTTEKAYASKTNSSRLAPPAFTGKATDNFPTHSLRREHEFNLSKAKGKMLQTDVELDSLSWQRNNMLVQDSNAYSGEKVRSTMPLTIQIPSAQGLLNRKGLEEGLHLSLNNYLMDAHTLLDARSNFKDVSKGIYLQDATKGRWNKTESERSRIISKKKNKKIQGVDNSLISEQPVGQHRENEETMHTTEKAYASKTNSSRLAPPAFTGKATDNFPTHSLRREHEFNLSKAKGKMLQTDVELDSLSWQRNNMLVQDSNAYSGEKVRSTMPLTIQIPSAQGLLNRKGLEEGLHLSLNNYLVDAHVYNKKCIHQIESHLPFSIPFQDGTSKVPQLKWKDSDNNVFGGQSIPSKNPTNALSGKAVHFEEINGSRNTQQTIEAVDQLGFVKRYSEQTLEVSEQGMLDDIPMEIVELLAKNQYERCLPDVENRSSTLEKPSLGRKRQIAGGSTVHKKGEMSLLKDGQKEKPQGKHKKNSMITRGENVKPGKRKPVHYFTPFDGNNLSMNNLCPPQPPFGLDVSQSQKKPSGGLQFSAIGSNQLGSSQNCRLNGSFEERGSPNATFQAPGGCSLHMNILHQDDEASRIWASLTSNHVSPGYDLPKRVVSSQHPSCNMNITSLQSGAFHKQNTKRDTDLNYMNLNAVGLEKLSRNTGSETFSRMNGEYSFPCKHSGMEPHQNLRGSLDLYSNDTIPAMHLLSLMDAGMQSRTAFDVGVSTQMLKRPSYPGDCNTKLEIGTSKPPGTVKRPSSDYCNRSFLSDKHGCFVGPPTFGASSSTPHDKKLVRATGFNGQNPTKSGKKEKLKNSISTQQNKIGKQISWPRNETETSLQRKLKVNGNHETPVPCKIISGNTCMVNRNPADLTIPETGNIYMIRGEDLKFEKSIPRNRLRFPIPYGYKQQRNLKGTRMKEHAKH